MFRFTIRDVLRLTLVVGLGSAWWMDHRNARQAASYFTNKLSHLQRVHDENNVKYHFVWRLLDDQQKQSS